MKITVEIGELLDERIPDVNGILPKRMKYDINYQVGDIIGAPWVCAIGADIEDVKEDFKLKLYELTGNTEYLDAEIVTEAENNPS